ncbi:MAG: CHAT domain-containing protein [Desulfobacterales bacterium]
MFVSQCVVLDADMSVSEVTARLARQGYWLDPTHPAVRPIIEESAERLKLPVEEVEQKLRRDFSLVGAAIRRQWYANILWYARPLVQVLYACYDSAAVDAPLLLALNLAETDSLPLLTVPPGGETPYREGVVMDGATPVAVSLEDWGAPPVEELGGAEETAPAAAPAAERGGPGELFSGDAPSRSARAPAPSAAVEPREVRAWPRIDAPSYVPARKPFDVTVGLAVARQPGVSGGQVVFHPPADARHVDVEVALIADGLDAPDGWSKMLPVDVDDPTAAEVTFRLFGHDPFGSEPVRLVTLEVRYSFGGSICGTASRPLVIGQADAPTCDLPEGYGAPWLAEPATASSVSVQADPDVADLTIEIFKPDGNPAKGSYICRLYSPHALACSMGPFPIELDDDAQSFAKAIVQQVRIYAKSPAVDNLLESHGRLIADKLGAGVIAALREVAAKVAPAVPAVLLVSAEPYVPWELAFIDPPLFANRPKYLGAQVILGRWLRDRFGSKPSPAVMGIDAAVVEKPPVQPPSRIDINHMAVMVGMYHAASGLRRLPEAEAEATALQEIYDAVPLAASLQAVKQLLDARLEHKFKSIGGVEIIHFAGHGDYDASNPDSAVLFLSDGMPLYAALFRSAKYGGRQSPMFFLNACMAGIGDVLLGDMGGFPGNCLKGGFGGVLGALWEVDDAMAHKLAIEFWHRALPLDGTSSIPVGEILRDIRAKYIPDPATAPAITYLAYVYYGHPRLTLRLVR